MAATVHVIQSPHASSTSEDILASNLLVVQVKKKQYDLLSQISPIKTSSVRHFFYRVGMKAGCVEGDGRGRGPGTIGRLYCKFNLYKKKQQQRKENVQILCIFAEGLLILSQ